MEQVAILVAIAFAVNKTVSVIKSIVNKDKNGAVTQVVVWVIGTLAIILASHAQLTEHLVIPGLTVELGSLDWPSQVLLGWIAGSTGSFAFDFKKAFDGTDTAAEPSLLPARTNAPVQAQAPPA